jgi:hypothetical protein
VANDDRVAVAPARAGALITRLGDRAGSRGIDGRACCRADIHALVAAAVPAGTVFIEGLVFHNQKWYLYYGCADSRVAVAVYDPFKK